MDSQAGTLKLKRLLNHLLIKHSLHPQSNSKAIDQIIEDLVGLHATASDTPYLSLHQRSRSFSKSQFDQALYEHHTAGKIRSVRKTLFVHSRNFLPVVFCSTHRMNQRASSSFMVRRGIRPEIFKELSQEILQVCSQKEWTAAQIREALDLDLDVYPILNLMCDQALLIRGRPWRGWLDKTQSYAKFIDYFPELNLDAYDEQQALRLLVERYLATFGPIQEKDLFWWMGLPKKSVKEAFESLGGSRVRVRIEGSPEIYWMHQQDHERLKSLKDSNQTVYNLLPILDPLLMGYRDRSHFLEEDHREYVTDRSGNVTSIILENGRVIGVWDRESGKRACVKLFLFRRLSKQGMVHLKVKVQYLARFVFDREVPVIICREMVPLPRRSAGSFIRPLKGCPAES